MKTPEFRRRNTRREDVNYNEWLYQKLIQRIDEFMNLPKFG